MKNYPEIVNGISANLKILRNDIGPTMQSFWDMSKAATQSGILDRKTKKLIALSIGGVAAHCNRCIGFHTEALVKLGASRAEVEEALGMAIYMGCGPALIYAADAIGAFDQFHKFGGRIVHGQPYLNHQPRSRCEALSRPSDLRVRASRRPGIVRSIP